MKKNAFLCSCITIISFRMVIACLSDLFFRTDFATFRLYFGCYAKTIYFIFFKTFFL